ncbi:hypothetical protein PMAC_000375 [Pneumocystis sp. 'macacae']|nr:hypothetical protein PMAC_000375 [Pneumocystis sp. 'macacae']
MKDEEASEFYPPFLFHHSPVYHTWVKLFASDVYTLRVIEGFEDGPTLFWLNHPIRWVHLMGVVVAMERYEKRDFVASNMLTVDDASGQIAELILKEDKHRQLIPEMPDAEGLLEIGTRIRVRGTFIRFHGRRQIRVIKLGTKKRNVINDPNIEVMGWEERLRLKQEVLSKAWFVDLNTKRSVIQSFLSKHNGGSAMMYGNVLLGEVISFKKMEEDEYTMRNLERLILSRVVKNNLREFTMSILRVDAEIEYAAKCVVIRTRQTSELDTVDGKNTIYVSDVLSGVEWSQSIEICRTIRNCLRRLVDNGLILLIDRTAGVYATLGDWNLRRLIRRCCREALYKWKYLKKRDLAKEKLIITNKDIWLEIRNHGDEWRLVNKTLVTNIIIKVMFTLSGWYYAGKEDYWVLEE